MKLLFVCTGNTCRSPMAEAIFDKIASDFKKDHTAFSRGTSVFFPQAINSKAVKALDKFGITGFSHTSTMVSEDDISSADLVLTMSASHKMALKTSFPQFKHKIFSLNEKAYGKDYDIEDPFGKSDDSYFECADEIYAAVEKLICML